MLKFRRGIHLRGVLNMTRGCGGFTLHLLGLSQLGHGEGEPISEPDQTEFCLVEVVHRAEIVVWGWVVGRTNSWHTCGFKKLLVCIEPRSRVVEALIALANASIITRRLIRHLDHSPLGYPPGAPTATYPRNLLVVAARPSARGTVG